VKAFYDSALKISQEKKARGIIDQEKFETETKDNLGLAVNRTKRLFKTNEDFSSQPGRLSSSKDTVYLEQFLLSEKLRSIGAEKYLLVGGVNLENLTTLAEIGLLDLKDIKIHTPYVLEIWEKVKDRYKA
jgi:hypothetical protein